MYMCVCEYTCMCVCVVYVAGVSVMCEMPARKLIMRCRGWFCSGNTHKLSNTCARARTHTHTHTHTHCMMQSRSFTKFHMCVRVCTQIPIFGSCGMGGGFPPPPLIFTPLFESCGVGEGGSVSPPPSRFKSTIWFMLNVGWGGCFGISGFPPFPPGWRGEISDPLESWNASVSRGFHHTFWCFEIPALSRGFPRTFGLFPREGAHARARGRGRGDPYRILTVDINSHLDIYKKDIDAHLRMRFCAHTHTHTHTHMCTHTHVTGDNDTG